MCQIFLFLMLFTSLQNPSPSRAKASEPQQNQPKTAQQPATTDERDTEQSPIAIKVIPTPKIYAETAEEAEDRKKKTTNDRKLVEFTRELVIVTAILAVVGFLQLFVFGYQARQLRKTVKGAADQSGAMERSINEANRLASAMEGIAEDIETSSKAASDSVAALRERTAQQMRAYLTIIVGTAIYQERTGPSPLKFEARPILLNSGHTPAHKVRYVAKAEILPVPLPDDFAFPLPDDAIGSAVLGPQQQNQLFAVVEDFCNDADVEKIKSIEGKGLYVWGVVRYEDIFKEPHLTRFCQLLTWQPDKRVFGFFIAKHQEAT